MLQKNKIALSWSVNFYIQSILNYKHTYTTLSSLSKVSIPTAVKDGKNPKYSTINVNLMIQELYYPKWSQN